MTRIDNCSPSVDVVEWFGHGVRQSPVPLRYSLVRPESPGNVGALFELVALHGGPAGGWFGAIHRAAAFAEMTH